MHVSQWNCANCKKIHYQSGCFRVARCSWEAYVLCYSACHDDTLQGELTAHNLQCNVKAIRINEKFFFFLHIFHVENKLLFHLFCQCANGVPVSLDQPHTSDSWPISEPLLLTNKISKPIIYVWSHARHLLCPPSCHRVPDPQEDRMCTFLDTNRSSCFLGM